jgi:hypothetical protein
MELPNPLIIHGINQANLLRYRTFIEQHGGQMEEVKKGADEGLYHLSFPEETTADEHRIRELDDPAGGYSQIMIGFPDGAYLTWFRIEKIGTEGKELHNRINISLV